MDPLVNDKIAGLVVSPLRVISDERGAVLHMLRSDSPEFVGFGEVYFSEVRPGMVKGWKMHTAQTQMFAVPTGQMRMVFFDPRDGIVQVIDMGRPDNYVRVTVPPGLWYAFGGLGDGPALLANCADRPHDPAESRSKPLDDASIPYRWALAGAAP